MNEPTYKSVLNSTKKVNLILAHFDKLTLALIVNGMTCVVVFDFNAFME